MGLKLDNHSVSCRAVSLNNTRVKLCEIWCESFHICRDLYLCRFRSVPVTETAVSLTVSCTEDRISQQPHSRSTAPQHWFVTFDVWRQATQKHPIFLWSCCSKYECFCFVSTADSVWNQWLVSTVAALMKSNMQWVLLENAPPYIKNNKYN